MPDENKRKGQTMKASKLTKEQSKKYTGELNEGGSLRVVVASVRWDDRCNNGHNTFSITGEVYGPHGDKREGSIVASSGKRLYLESCGCVHEDIARAIPELAPLLKWHLCSSDGPLHYLENVVYLAGDRDCWGLRKGEFKQHTSRGSQNGGVSGVPNWVLEMPEGMKRDVYAKECPAPVVLEWKAYGRTGEGKSRELDKARYAAVWPDASDADLMLEPDELRETLRARLPALLESMRRDVESIGFTW
jgi:hypothetical protein